MIVLCPACHQAKHMGLANVQGKGAQARPDLARVNGWTPEQTDAYISQAFPGVGTARLRTLDAGLGGTSSPRASTPAVVRDLAGHGAGRVSSRRAGRCRAGHPCPRSQPQVLGLREGEMLALPAPWPLPWLGRRCSICLAATRCLADKPPATRQSTPRSRLRRLRSVSRRQRCRAQHRSDRRRSLRRASERHVGPATIP
jgi:hypothetical protein